MSKINIFNYIISIVIAIFLGQVSFHIIRYIPTIIEEKKAYEKFFSIFNFKNHPIKIDYIYSSIYVILFFLILQVYEGSLAYIYMLAFSFLIIALIIDFKMKLIPDTSVIVIFILGVINAVLNYSNALNYIYGFLIGGCLFYLISIFSKLVFKKEGMGFGDVKLVAAIGLLVGYKSIFAISLLAFVLSAVISLILIILNKAKFSSYIAFGPFIVVATIIVIFFGSEVFIDAYFNLCTWLSDMILNATYKIIN